MSNRRVLGGMLGVAALFVPFALSASGTLVEERNWSTEAVVKNGFTGLGNYVIRLVAFTDYGKYRTIGVGNR